MGTGAGHCDPQGDVHGAEPDHRHGRGLPIGVVLHDVIFQVMAGQVGNDISSVQYQVFGPAVLAGLVAAGIAVAVLGAYLPVRWAARTSVVDVLRAEWLQAQRSHPVLVLGRERRCNRGRLGAAPRSPTQST